MPVTAADRLMELYPRIFFACHQRHRRDPKTRRLLSAHQASVLDHLDEVEPMALSDLARHMGVTPATMSVAIDRLARRGYVIRARDPGDGRRLHLRLSSAGVRVKEATSVLEPDRVAALLELLGPRERERALEGLALLARAAEALMAEGAGRRRGGDRRRR
jgi:DNA-binding MarR family transcriptional regulator